MAEDCKECKALREQRDTFQAEIERLRAELEAWRRSFPTQHVRPGDAYCCTKLESYEQ